MAKHTNLDTQARQVVHYYHGDLPDGSEWPDGFLAAIGDWATEITTKESAVRWEFSDGSALVEQGNGCWDFGIHASRLEAASELVEAYPHSGYPALFCWPEAHPAMNLTWSETLR